jgi:hypothetical protein
MLRGVNPVFSNRNSNMIRPLTALGLTTFVAAGFVAPVHAAPQ